ncbi:hypothetical protein [Vibrio parahaemolyticus]|uniref:hypothetical protein n=1 Tax=Vibrio parahaemolyticus TaxID=670 RepID=UPI003AF7278B|nr:hypothetical protein [Vibrio parahaemolyticus]
MSQQQFWTFASMNISNPLPLFAGKLDVFGQLVLPLVFRKIYAKIFGYSWLTCSCGREFGGFESRYCKVVMVSFEKNQYVEHQSRNHQEALLLCPICSSKAS